MKQDMIRVIHGDDIFVLTDTNAYRGNRYEVTHHVEGEDCLLYAESFKSEQKAKQAFYRELLQFEGGFYQDNDEEISVNQVLDELRL